MPAHVADEPCRSRELAQAGQQALARARPRVRLQPLVREARRARRARPRAETGLPPKVLKYSIPVANERRDLGRRHDGAQRVAVADRLAQRDDVGHDALRLEAPEVRADAAEADLHLVGDADPARGRARARRRRRGTRRRARPGRRARQRLGEERRGRRPDAASRRAAVDLGEVRAYRGRRRPGASGTGRGRGPAAGRRAWSAASPTPPGPSNLYGLTSISEREVAVVGVVEHEHVARAGVRVRQPQREVVRLGAGVDEEARPTAGRAASRRAGARSSTTASCR